MARGFDMNTTVEIADAGVAKAIQDAAKNKSYHHNLLLGRLQEVNKATCAELCTWLETNKATLMTEGQVATWDKYSDGCHLSYFVNRMRGAVKATRPDGTVITPVVRKGKAKAETPAEPATPAQPVEAPAPVTELADATA